MRATKLCESCYAMLQRFSPFQLNGLFLLCHLTIVAIAWKPPPDQNWWSAKKAQGKEKPMD